MILLILLKRQKRNEKLVPSQRVAVYRFDLNVKTEQAIKWTIESIMCGASFKLARLKYAALNIKLSTFHQ